MAKVLVTESYLTDIANAIRTKSGTTITYAPGEMAEAIINISTGGGANTEDALLTGTYAGPYANDRITALKSAAFVEQQYITTIDLPNVKSIASDSNLRPFDSCSVTGINLPELTKVGDYCFTGAANLQSISAPKVTSIGMYGINCSKLTSVDMPNVTYIGSYGLGSCGFTTINLPLVTQLRKYAFNNCTKLRTISLPSLTTAESYDADNSSQSGYQFNGCSALTTASFALLPKISSHMFYNCKALTSVSAPVATTISRYAFYGCTALAKVDSTMFPAITSIDRYAFYGCTNLQTVEFDQYVSMSDTYKGFYNCSNLQSVICRSGCAIGSTTFETTPLRGGGGYLYVPRSYVTSITSIDSALSVRALENYTVDGTTTGALDPNKI